MWYVEGREEYINPGFGGFLGDGEVGEVRGWRVRFVGIRCHVGYLIKLSFPSGEQISVTCCVPPSKTLATLLDSSQAIVSTCEFGLSYSQNPGPFGFSFRAKFDLRTT